MKKRYYSFVALTITFAMLILTTGCGVRINGNDYELFKVSDEDKHELSFGIGSESSNTQQISEDKQDGEQFFVDSNAGNIEIKKSDSTQVEIKADKKVRGSSDDDKQTILDNMNIALERDGKIIKVVIKTKDGKDFWDWQKDKFRTYQININYYISLPQGINLINADTGAGNIDIKDAAAKLTLDTGAGNIVVKDVTALQDSTLSTGAGNIDFEGDVDDISSFDASTGAGNIDFQVPGDTEMSLEADTGIGVLSGDFIDSDEDNKFHFSGDINGGGPSVTLDTGVGNISVGKD